MLSSVHFFVTLTFILICSHLAYSLTSFGVGLVDGSSASNVRVSTSFPSASFHPKNLYPVFVGSFSSTSLTLMLSNFEFLPSSFEPSNNINVTSAFHHAYKVSSSLVPSPWLVTSCVNVCPAVYWLWVFSSS